MTTRSRSGDTHVGLVVSDHAAAEMHLAPFSGTNCVLGWKAVEDWDRIALAALGAASRTRLLGATSCERLARRSGDYCFAMAKQ